MDMSKWPAAQVELVLVENLVPYARNSRTHDDAQVAQIAASIKEWGWTTPVLIDEAGMLIAGHGRILAAQRLGLTQVPAMTARGWSEAQKKAYVIADNKLALNAGWDNDLLKIELADLRHEDFDLRLTGFDGDELSRLMAEDNVNFTSENDESASGADRLYLKIGKDRIPMTEVEYHSLHALLEKYTEEFGATFGFAAWLAEKATQGEAHAAP